MTRAVLLLLVLLAPACSGREDASRPPWDEALTAELLRRVAEDQAVRERLTSAMRAGGAPDTALFAELVAVDSANTAWLREAVALRGWPSRDAVGKEAANAAFLLVQHADRDTAFQAAMLPELEAAYRRGQADGQSVALLTDRLAVARGAPQVYGSQVRITDGRMVLAPVADSAGLDARRAAMGLPPMREYLRVLDSVYVGGRSP